MSPGEKERTICKLMSNEFRCSSSVSLGEIVITAANNMKVKAFGERDNNRCPTVTGLMGSLPPRTRSVEVLIDVIWSDISSLVSAIYPAAWDMLDNNP